MRWSRASVNRGSLVLGVVVVLLCAPARGDECWWKITTHVTPEPTGFYMNQGPEKLWLFLHADPVDQIWSFDPWEGIDTTHPAAMYHHQGAPGVVVLDGSVYFAGGGTTCERYTPGEGWEQVADLPEARFIPSAEALNGKIYLFGGFRSGDTGPADETYIYDPDTDTWTDGPNMVYAGGRRASAVVGDAIYVMGGTTHGGSDSPGQTWFEKFEEGVGWTDLGPLPELRNGPAAVDVRNRIYLTGGRPGSSATVDNHVWVYDTDAPEEGWLEGPDMHYDRMYHGLGAFGIGVYAVGGVGADEGPWSSVERLLTTGDCCTSADVDGDGDVDLADLAELLGHYGETCP